MITRIAALWTKEKLMPTYTYFFEVVPVRAIRHSFTTQVARREIVGVLLTGCSLSHGDLLSHANMVVAGENSILANGVWHAMRQVVCYGSLVCDCGSPDSNGHERVLCATFITTRRNSTEVAGQVSRRRWRIVQDDPRRPQAERG